jgi:hypothetical protein
VDYWLCAWDNSLAWYSIANVEMSIETFIEEIKGRKGRQLEALAVRLAEENTALQFNRTIRLRPCASISQTRRN